MSVEELPDLDLDIMLDSGAFSAWTHGEKINIEDYIAFCRYYGDIFSTIVNLDVIPGDYGRRKTQADVERAAQESYENLLIMKDAGLNPIPVFHQGEDFSYLERMIDDGEEYIGISPSGDSVSMNVKWFQNVFRVITDDEGYPIVKTHGFGVTSLPILIQFPWYSADSVSWVIKPGYGNIFIPQMRDDRTPDYSSMPITVGVTGGDKKPSRLEFENMSVHKGTQNLYSDWVNYYLTSILDTNPAEVRYSLYTRMELMAHFFKEVRKHLSYSRFVDSSFAFTSKKFTNKRVTWKEKHMVFAVGTALSSIKRSAILNVLGIQHRLLSYYALTGVSEQEMRTYGKKGVIRPYRQNSLKSNWNSVIYLNKRRIALSGRVYNSEVEEDNYEPQRVA